jgi:exosortase C (VPDSG-CTERM-specific)
MKPMEKVTTPSDEVLVKPARGWWPEDRRTFVYAAFVAVLSLAFLSPLVALFRLAMDEELNSHILLIPVVSLYLAGGQRNHLAKERKASPVGWVIFALLAVAVYGVPKLAGWSASWSLNDWLTQSTACYVLLLVGGGFAILGTTWMRVLAFPFAFLIFMVPMPDVFTVGFEELLMRWSAWMAEILFHLTGTSVHRDGQLIELPGMLLMVARECSGIRSTVVLFITSVLASYMFLKSPWHRGILVALVIPLGILRNAFRVLVIGLLCVHIGPEMIDSWVHHQGGPLFFGISLVPLFLTAAWFRFREVKQERVAIGSDSPSKNP